MEQSIVSRCKESKARRLLLHSAHLACASLAILSLQACGGDQDDKREREINPILDQQQIVPSIPENNPKNPQGPSRKQPGSHNQQTGNPQQDSNATKTTAKEEPMIEMFGQKIPLSSLPQGSTHTWIPPKHRNLFTEFGDIVDNAEEFQFDPAPSKPKPKPLLSEFRSILDNADDLFLPGKPSALFRKPQLEEPPTFDLETLFGEENGP